MHEPSYPTVHVQSQLAQVARSLGWLSTGGSATEVHAAGGHAAEIAVPFRHDDCCLNYLLRHTNLKQHGRSQLGRLVQQGISLRATWPRPTSTQRWLGNRFYLSHSRNFASSTKYASLVSSQLGRHFAKLPHWPRLLESALRQIRKHHWTLLLAPGTTLFEHSKAFAARATMHSVELNIASENESLAEWLVRSLGEEGLEQRIFISPHVEHESIHVADQAPVQDRASIMLPDSVFVFSVRPRGTVERLVDERLTSRLFQLGSIQINAESKSKNRRSKLEAWLDQGAVAWHLSTAAETTVSLSACTTRPTPALQQVCFRMPPSWSTIADEDWPWLVHCTRANIGPRPSENSDQYRDRLWIDGYLAEDLPVHTLHRICAEQTLIGSSRITRSELPCVCFSSVPLPQLLSNRQFQSHLSRWDWEPYGVLFRRTALQNLGARPVIYGNHRDYSSLSLDEQPFFQSLGKNDIWAKEREYRILGDVKLSQFSRGEICLFVRDQKEASYFARRFPWPVTWVGPG